MKRGSRHRGAWRGFTILEILLVLALLGFLSTGLVVGGARLLAERPQSPEDVFWEAVRQARDYALLRNRDVSLRYDREARAFIAGTAEGEQLFPVPADVGGEDLRIEFLSTQKFEATVLIGGVLLETATLPQVTFYADGTCTPFRVQLRNGVGGVPVTLAIDPWTCAPVLTAAGTAGRN